jgi:hypothetical protein
MMGPRQIDQAALFYEFSLERHVPATHLLRSIDRFVDLSDVRSHLAPFYSSTGRPSSGRHPKQVETDRRNNEQVHGGNVWRVVVQEGPPSPARPPPPFDHVTWRRSTARSQTRA